MVHTRTETQSDELAAAVPLNESFITQQVLQEVR